jgi:hypothetical protein
VTTPSFPSKFAIGEWVEFHWQNFPAPHGRRWGQVAETDWWPYNPEHDRYQEESWGYRMEGYELWIYESDIIRKLSLLEIIAAVAREDGE